ncbi:class A sortase [Lactobacillus helveticus]|uniref:class A sortase n=1 Tax=Lactobacillus helveticus TaxID=1587 RepID=UPI001D1040BA|nr:class A sortase [Lactobacillus helveticus]
MKNVQPVSPKSLANAYQHRRDYRSVGQIVIRNQNILLNIYRGVGNLELNLGAGTMNQHQKMGEGNYALAGHNMDNGRTFFSPLYTAKVRGNLPNGTTIFLTDYKKVYYYKIMSSSFISVYNLKLAWNNKKFKEKPVISLFTCDWTGQGRLFIRGKYTGSQSYKGASKYVRSSFNF